MFLALSISCGWRALADLQPGAPQVFIKERNRGRLTFLTQEALSEYDKKSPDPARDMSNPTEEALPRVCPGLELNGTEACSGGGTCDAVLFSCSCEDAYVGAACVQNFTKGLLSVAPRTLDFTGIAGGVMSKSASIAVFNMEQRTITVEAGARSKRQEVQVNVTARVVTEPQLAAINILPYIGVSWDRNFKGHDHKTYEIETSLFAQQIRTETVFKGLDNIAAAFVDGQRLASGEASVSIEVPLSNAGNRLVTVLAMFDDGTTVVNGTYTLHLTRPPPTRPNPPELLRVTVDDAAVQVLFLPP